MLKDPRILRPAPPSVLIWDIGGVLIRYRNLWEDGEFVGNCACGVAEIERFFTSYPFFLCEESKISDAELFGLVKEQLGYKFDLGKFAVDFCECCRFELDREVFKLFLYIKVKYADVTTLWALSNVNKIHYDYFRKLYPGLYANFSELFLSFEMGARKPDLAIYERMCGMGGVSYSDCLLIDDNPENGVAPKQLGMGFVHFENSRRLRLALAVRGIVI